MFCWPGNDWGYCALLPHTRNDGFAASVTSLAAGKVVGGRGLFRALMALMQSLTGLIATHSWSLVQLRKSTTCLVNAEF